MKILNQCGRQLLTRIMEADGKVKDITLEEGPNEFPKAVWTKLSKRPIIAKRIARDQIIPISDSAKASAADTKAVNDF